MDIIHSFIPVVAVISLVMLVWACVEVGSNDAANLVNAVFGARILKRESAIFLAGLFVIIGSAFASPVMNTIRKGIFDVGLLNANQLVSIFLSSYLVNTVLLFAYSAYGLPVSTTATLVFSLMGAALGVSWQIEIIHWNNFLKVIVAIFISIFLSAIMAYTVQKLFRTVIGNDSRNPCKVKRHGPWITGFFVTGLTWFLLVEGIDLNFLLPSTFNFGHYFIFIFLFLEFILITFITKIVLMYLGDKGTYHLFDVTSILGMICMAFAFGQNDLANCASPGIAVLMIWKEGMESANSVSVPIWGLVACGFFIFLGMRTKRAQRVTRAEVNTASQQNKVKLYAPQWCIKFANIILRKKERLISSQMKEDDFAPEATRDADGKKLHYDTLRASVILAVSASVIAVASGLGLPISTTYVNFAAVIATGSADNIFVQRGGGELKLGRTIWVVVSWFMAGALGILFTALASFTIYKLEFFGIVLSVFSNITLRFYFKRKAEEHENIYHVKKKKFKQS